MIADWYRTHPSQRAQVPSQTWLAFAALEGAKGTEAKTDPSARPRDFDELMTLRASGVDVRGVSARELFSTMRLSVKQ